MSGFSQTGQRYRTTVLITEFVTLCFFLLEKVQDFLTEGNQANVVTTCLD